VIAEIVAALAILAVMALYLYWTAGRLDRLHARVDSAAAALDAQLARRSTLVIDLSGRAELPSEARLDLQPAATRAAQIKGLTHEREVAENALTRALARAVAASPASFTAHPAVAVTLRDEALRVQFARGFYNDAVRDALIVRDRRIVRWLRLAGHAPHPSYFEMDDEELPAARISVAIGPTIEG
jgi:hypothetical protein